MNLPIIYHDFIGKLMAFLCAFFWAIAVILFKKSGETIPPFALNLYKTLVATSLFIITLICFNIPFIPEELTLTDYIKIFLSGLLGITISDSLFFKSLNMLGASLNAIVDCIYAPMMILISYLFFSEPLDLYKITGCLLVILAVIIGSLKNEENNKTSRNIIIGVFLSILSIFFVIISVILMKPIITKVSPLWVTTVRTSVALISLIGITFFSSNYMLFINYLYKKNTWKVVFTGSFLGNYIAMILWIAAFKYTDMGSAAILNQTNVVFIILFASIFLKEPFSLRIIVSGIMAISGSILVMKG